MPTRLAPAQRLPTRRLLDLERAKGVAIALVVLGHLAREAPPQNEWYGVLKDSLYLFHMPLFMFLSGVTMYLSYKPIRGTAEYGNFVWAKFTRLMPAFFAFGAIVLLGKDVASGFLPIVNLPPDLLSGAWTILTKPIASSAGFLWYIYTLFLFYAVMPLLMRAGAKNLAPVVCVSAVLHFVPIPASVANWFMLAQFAEYLLYVSIGFVIARNYDVWTKVLDRHGAWFIAAFVGCIAIFVLLGEQPIVTSKTFVGLIAIPAIHAMVRARPLANSSTLAKWGAYSFTIYLFNLVFIGVLMGIAMKYGLWGGRSFLLVSAGLFACGLLLPIVTSKVLLQRVRWLDRMTR